MSVMKTYNINEIFYSLQGEGHYSGTPTVFLRMSGCNLRCPFCDTDFSRSQPMTAAEILTRCMALTDVRRVVITGGEPLLQLDDTLIAAFHEAGFFIAVETNGTRALPDGIDWVTCSPKEGSRVLLSRADELKMVYIGQDVESWHRRIVADYYFLQPCSMANTSEVVDYIKSHPWWQLSLQTHKLAAFK